MVMEKTMAMIAVALCALVLISFSRAVSATPESYYNQCLSKKIAKLERQAKKVDSVSECIRNCAKFSSLQANFFRTHREELVREMVALKVEIEPYKVDYFLIKAFFKANPKLVCHLCPSHLYLCEYLKSALMEDRD